MPPTAAAATSSGLASAYAISAFLPPSSSNSGLTVALAARITARPAATLPMIATMPAPGCEASAAPVSRPPGTTLKPRAGNRPSTSSARRSADKGAWSGGFITMEFPAASGAARFAGGEHERMIERHDARHHAYRLAHGKIDDVGSHRDRRALHLGDQPGEKIQLRGGDHRVTGHFANRTTR